MTVPQSPDLLRQESRDLMSQAMQLNAESDILLAQAEILEKISEHRERRDESAQRVTRAEQRLADATAYYEPMAAQLGECRQTLAANPEFEDSPEVFDSISLEDRVSRDTFRAGVQAQEAKLARETQRRWLLVTAAQDELRAASEHAAWSEGALARWTEALGNISLTRIRELSQIAPAAAMQRATREGINLAAMYTVQGDPESMIDAAWVQGVIRANLIKSGVMQDIAKAVIEDSRRTRIVQPTQLVPDADYMRRTVAPEGAHFQPVYPS